MPPTTLSSRIKHDDFRLMEVRTLNERLTLKRGLKL